VTVYLPFGKQTVSVNCSYWRQILHIWSGSRAAEEQLLYVENCPWWAAEFGKPACGIW